MVGDWLRSGRVRPWVGLLVFLGFWPMLARRAAEGLVVGADCERGADALVVLAGGESYAERTRVAAALFRRSAAPVILLTNDGARGSYFAKQKRNPWMVERSAWSLIEQRVPIERIKIVPGIVTSTYDEAKAIHRYARETSLGSILIVTSGYHTRRARWTYHDVFGQSPIDVYMCGSPPRPENRPGRWWWSLGGWQEVGGEYLRWIWYVLRY